MEKVLFIYNPNAGRGIIRNHLSAIVEIMCGGDAEITIYATNACGDARCIVTDKGGIYDRIVCCGGDGTLNEVTGGLMSVGKMIPCGYIPAGTVNDFAHSFKLPSGMEDAARIAMTGRPFLCDVGEINGDYFDYIAAFGAFTEVSYETSQFSKNILGKLAYFLEGVKRIPALKRYNIRAEWENGGFEDEIIYGMVTNSFSVGGFLSLFDDDVALDDGRFEAFFIKAPKNIMELQAIAGALIKGDVSCRYFHYYHVEHIVISCDEAVRWTVDGEFGGEYTEADINNHMRAVSFIRGE